MILPGHIASVSMVARWLKVDRPTALAASLFPDLVDKGLHWALHVTPSDRLWAHTVWAWAGSSALAWLYGRVTHRPGTGRAWLLGYIVHFLGDVTAPLPLLYPLSTRGYHHGARMRETMRGERRFPWRVLAVEGLLALAAGATELYARRKRKGE